MNKLWTTFMIVAIISMLVVIAYQSLSFSSGATTFTATVLTINPDLGLEGMRSFQPLTANQPIRDASLDPVSPNPEQ